MKSFKLILIALLVMFSVSAFARRNANKITIAGSTTVLPIAQSCAEIFMDKHPEIDISVRGGGSSVGIASVMAGTVDIGDASRHAKTKEKVQAKSNGINLYENVVANDGIAPVVHKSNTVNALTLDQLRDIYTGKIQNWKELGGPNKPIVVISRDVSSGTFEVFNKLALRGAKQRSDASMLASNNAVASTVASTPGAIGYVGIGYITNSINVCTVDGVKPTKKTIQTKEFPIARTLHMYTNGKPKGLTKKFIDFILSAEGQKLVEENGFISIN
jgi:phosphate transport system substrate-binding protein